MEDHPDFAAGRLNCASGRDKHKKLWLELATLLNAAGFGEKTVDKWQKVLNILSVNIFASGFCLAVVTHMLLYYLQFLDMERF